MLDPFFYQQIVLESFRCLNHLIFSSLEGLSLPPQGEEERKLNEECMKLFSLSLSLLGKVVEEVKEKEIPGGIQLPPQWEEKRFLSLIQKLDEIFQQSPTFLYQSVWSHILQVSSLSPRTIFLSPLCF